MTKSRTAFTSLTDQHRDKIRNANILNDLIEFFLGRKELTPLRVHVGIELLKKVLPNLAQVDVTAQHQHNINYVRFLTDDEWLKRKASQSIIALEDNSETSTLEESASPSVCVIDEQAKH